jgi:hypothetical protein
MKAAAVLGRLINEPNILALDIGGSPLSPTLSLSFFLQFQTPSSVDIKKKEPQRNVH